MSLVIDVTYASDVTPSNFSGGATEEAAFETAITYVVNELESLFTNNATIMAALEHRAEAT